MQQGEGVFVARTHHTGRRPGSDIQPRLVERAAAGFQRADQFREARGILAGRLFTREALAQLAAKGLADQAAEQRMNVRKALVNRFRHALHLEVKLGELAAEVQGEQHGSKAVQV